MQEAEKDLSMKEENEISGGDSRVYELGYLLASTIAEDNVPATYGNLKEVVASFGGVFISDDMPKMISLAYTMDKVVSNVRNKFNSAYFGWMKFSMDPEKVPELKKKLDLSNELIRFLIIKTVKENTIASKRFVSREGGYRKPFHTEKEKGSEEAQPINKEEIDKEIDAMIAV